MNFKKLQRSSTPSELFCVPSVLARFGIEFPNRPAYNWEIKKALSDNGYEIDVFYTASIGNGDARSRGFWPSLTRVLREVYGGLSLDAHDLVLFTSRHVLCIKDGLLTDTEKNRAGRRHCHEYWVVRKVYDK